MNIIFTGLHKSGAFDLEAVEMATRAATHQLGAKMIEQLLSAPAEFQRTVLCDCGQSARFHELRPKRLITVLGPITIHRPYYICPQCHRGQSPRDTELDVQGTQYSPGVRRMMAVVGSETSFEDGQEQLELLAGFQVTAKAVERQAEIIGEDIAAREQQEICRAKQLELPQVCVPSVPILYIEMDGTGVPVVKTEVEDRAGKIEGLPAHTREVKLGCVFTQTKTDKEGRPVRDENSTTYVGAIESAEEFGARLYTEAWQRGGSRALTKVILGDGAIWIWNTADQHFPGAIQIVDLYHAREHLWELSAKLFANDEKGRKRWITRYLKLLDQGKIEKLVELLRELRPANQDLDKLVNNEAEYFQRNAERMRYPVFRARGFFVGSGVIEAACKTVIGSRLKQSGMFWTVRGANSIVALRCNRLSGKFEDYWGCRSKAA